MRLEHRDFVMKFVDEATLLVEAGKGGNGSGSFRREKYVPFGGPDGGDGGDGGDVYLQAHKSLNTLVDFRYLRQVKAGNGDCGHGRQRYGKKGEHKIIQVPVGTCVYDMSGELIGDLTQAGQTLLVAKGGQGGLGNIHFKSSTNQAPKKTTPGKLGESRSLKLELKLLADVGLLGLPNAGKSTFIRSVSAARPKVADYPFTTLVPQLGTVSLGKGSSFVIADIPGIIEGASEGAGLGLKFLRHLARTKALLHLVDVSSLADVPYQKAIPLILDELKAFGSLLDKPRWLILNKIDMLDEADQTAILEELKEQFADTPIYAISNITRGGLESLIQDLGEFVMNLQPQSDERLEEEVFEEESEPQE